MHLERGAAGRTKYSILATSGAWLQPPLAILSLVFLTLVYSFFLTFVLFIHSYLTRCSLPIRDTCQSQLIRLQTLRPAASQPHVAAVYWLRNSLRPAASQPHVAAVYCGILLPREQSHLRTSLPTSPLPECRLLKRHQPF